MVKPNGVLLYSVCTLVPEENEKLCERFLREKPEFRIDEEQISTLPSASHLFKEGVFFTTNPLCTKWMDFSPPDLGREADLR